MEHFHEDPRALGGDQSFCAFFEALRETGIAELQLPRQPGMKGLAELESREVAVRQSGRLMTMLHDWHKIDALEAGIPIFREEAAWWGARTLVRCSWLMLERASSEAVIEPALALVMPSANSADAHFSADLTLRWLPGLYAQAHSMSPTDPLIDKLRQLAKRVPLSGVGIPWRNDLTSSASIEIPAIIRDHPGIWRLLVDRVIRARDKEKLANPAILESVRASLGAFAKDLAGAFLDSAVSST